MRLESKDSYDGKNGVIVRKLKEKNFTKTTQYWFFLEKDSPEQRVDLLLTQDQLDQRVALWAAFCSDAFLLPKNAVVKSIVATAKLAVSNVFYAEADIDFVSEGRRGQISQEAIVDAGFIIIQFPTGAEYPILEYICVGKMFRTPALRVGTALLDTYEEIVKANVKQPVTVEIDAINNARSRDWYRKNGYTYVDANPPPPVPDNVRERLQAGLPVDAQVEYTVKMKKEIV